MRAIRKKQPCEANFSKKPFIRLVLVTKHTVPGIPISTRIRIKKQKLHLGIEKQRFGISRIFRVFSLSLR